MTPTVSAGRWWEARPRPALLLVAGLCLGPQGVNIINSAALDLLDPTIPVALVALGMLLPLLRGPRSLLAESAPVIAAALIVIAIEAQWAIGAVLADRGLRLLEATGAAALIAAAGALLLARISAAADRRVVVLALLLLTGGLADFLAVPGVAIGIVVASTWRLISRTAMVSATKDLDYLAGPLVAAMLLIAGARLDVSAEAVGLAAALAFVAFAATRFRGGELGVIALGLAVDLTRGISIDSAIVIDACVIAVVLVQLTLAGFAPRGTSTAHAAGAAA